MSGAPFGSKAALVAGAAIGAASFAVLTGAHSRPSHVYLSTALLAFAAVANLIVLAVPPEQTGSPTA